MSEIKFFHRNHKKIEIEKVYGDKWLELLYNTKLGQSVSKLLAGKMVSQLYGGLQDLPITRSKVPEFVKNFNINMEEFRPGSVKNPKSIEESYRCFNEFFIREFVEGSRSYPEDPHEMGAPAEARYLGYSAIDPDQTFPVKGEELSSRALLDKEQWNEVFAGGPLMIARLCPVDYHRYHYPLSGKVLDYYRVNGDYYSVNPLALRFKDDIFSGNERVVTILETADFGRIAYIEVGATMVGKIVQSHDIQSPFEKGQEKGYFLFGASTVIVLGEKGKWKPVKDISLNSSQKLETYVQLGQVVATLRE